MDRVGPIASSDPQVIPRPDGDSIFTAGPVRHVGSLPVSAVVHSCGVGTTAAGLRAGVPTAPSPGPHLEGASPVWASRLMSGARVAGTVRRSVLGPGVIIERGAEVLDSIVFSDTIVRANARVGIGERLAPASRRTAGHYSTGGRRHRRRQ